MHYADIGNTILPEVQLSGRKKLIVFTNCEQIRTILGHFLEKPTIPMSVTKGTFGELDYLYV